MQNLMTQAIAVKFAALAPLWEERTRRRWAAGEARALGRGGILGGAEATGLSRATIRAGVGELNAPGVGEEWEARNERIRRAGGGRRPRLEGAPRLLPALEWLVEAVTRGDPMSPRRWTCKSAARLGAERHRQGQAVSERTVNRLLHALGYSLRSTRKTLEGRQHRDRDAPFPSLNRRVKAFQRQGQPVVSGDTKKKEVVG